MKWKCRQRCWPASLKASNPRVQARYYNAFSDLALEVTYHHNYNITWFIYQPCLMWDGTTGERIPGDEDDWEPFFRMFTKFQ